ncbi:Kinesin-Like Protein Kif13B [Manis pentadactyla]|nr:Kinesin-Like Protein Kif13B [Manis pentadactyla]
MPAGGQPASRGRVSSLGPGAPPARLRGGVGEAGPGTLARRSSAAPPAGALLPRPGSGPGGAGTGLRTCERASGRAGGALRANGRALQGAALSWTQHN